MKNIIVIVVCIMLFYILHSFNNPHIPKNDIKKNKQVEYQVNLTGMEGINYSFVDIPEGVIDYLKNKSNFYKDLYKQNKKFAIYFVGMGCPYGQTFSEIVEKIKNDEELRDKYNFYALDISSSSGELSPVKDPKEAQLLAQASMDFYNKICHEFCIVNPVKKQVFGIEGVGYKEAEKLPYIFAKLKNW